MDKVIDIEDLNRKFTAVYSRDFPVPSNDDIAKYKALVLEILQSPDVIGDKEYVALKRKHKFNNKKSFLFHVYLDLKRHGELAECGGACEEVLRKTLQIKGCKSWSGIVTITIFTSAHPEYTNAEGERVAQEFSCAFSCSYCPKQDGMPRSYLLGEPAVLRAARNDFDCARQMWDRMRGLYMTGHDVCKIECIVSGGTWASYPIEYRREFSRDLYYAANVFWEWWADKEKKGLRPRGSLEDEKRINRTAQCRIVGLTIETRPDCVDASELVLLRECGVTRVQLGIQHINDKILRGVNRKCPIARAAEGIRMLKRNCFKIDSHWMLNLPGASAYEDDYMLNEILLGLKGPVVRRRMSAGFDLHEEYDLIAPELSTDTWKIYPTAVTPWTDIETWFREGKYKPYDEGAMFDVLHKCMSLVFPWIRVARVIRDIPTDYQYNQGTGADNTSMRQVLDDSLKRDGVYCWDIRNREVKNRDWDGNYIVVARKYNGSCGNEYFISAESGDCKVLYGFVRLRLDDAENKVFGDELNGAALIRELHVYGDATQVGTKGQHVQHRGLGRLLMNKAMHLARSRGYKKVAVIAAEGNKEYYENKLGFQDTGYFMTRSL